MTKIENWLRQPTTIHAIGVIAGAVGAGLSQVTTANPTWDAVIGVAAYVLVHLGINDHTAFSSDLSAAVVALSKGSVQAAGVDAAKAMVDAKL